MIPVMRPWLGPEEAAAVAEVMASGWVAQGPRVAAFEKALATKVGVPHAIATSSCTGALHLALAALNVGPGDEVVAPSLSFIATANVIRYVGASPVFADVDPLTQNISAPEIARVLSPKTKAVIIVHQGGVPTDIRSIRELCEPRGVAIVEDAACALGSSYEGALIGSHSDFVAYSFHPRKVITTGEGGMLVTGRADLVDRLRRLRDHGMSISAAQRHESRTPVIEHYLETGFNYRLSDIQAAVGIVQLGRLDAIVARRRQLAHRYQRQLAGIEGLSTAADPPYGTSNFQSFWITLPDDFPVARDDLMTTMMQRGISPRRGFMAAHLEPAYADVRRTMLPVTERLTRQSIILPLFYHLTESEQDQVIAVIEECARLSPRTGDIVAARS